MCTPTVQEIVKKYFNMHISLHGIVGYYRDSVKKDISRDIVDMSEVDDILDMLEIKMKELKCNMDFLSEGCSHSILVTKI